MRRDQLLQRAAVFKMPEDELIEKERGRKEFIERFPLSSLSDLSLEDYVPGGLNRDSFCYWLEFKNILFGIGGGNALKFGIYLAGDGNYYKGSSSHKTQMDVQFANREFSRIKAELVHIIDLAKQDRIDQIDESRISLWSMVLQKILCIYFPEKFCTVGADNIITSCAHDLAIPDISQKGLIMLNHAIREEFSKHSVTRDWDYEKLGTFIWKTYREQMNRSYYIIGSMYANKDIFPQMYEKSVISIGYAQEHDLSDLYGKKQAEITSYLSDLHENIDSQYALKHFLNIKKNDWVAIKRSGSPRGKEGYLSIIAIAKVCERDGKVYTYDPNDLGHCIYVEFIQPRIFNEFSYGGYGRAIHKLTLDKKREMIEDIFFNDHYHQVPDSIAEPDIGLKGSAQSIDIPLNTILFGPPGTGKTYKILNEYERLFTSEDGRIKRYDMITFHQSYTYEDFIEGIKPVLNEDSGNVSYRIEPGIFLKLAGHAAEDPDHPYAIFIDEINRGNVAGIFGELITLIEPDKRAGEKHEISTVLPYSKEPFSVPGNLWIIGTMNTADRSIEALDTALRRRFSFIEVNPDPSIFFDKDYSDDDLDIARMLQAVNERIGVLLDRDHTIGHSYFMNMQKESRLEDIRRIFQDKIIPLLEEYFYGDRGKIKMILGPAFVKESAVNSVHLFPLNYGDGDIRDDDSAVFHIEIPDTLEGFRSIYEISSN